MDSGAEEFSLQGLRVEGLRAFIRWSRLGFMAKEIGVQVQGLEVRI